MLLRSRRKELWRVARPTKSVAWLSPAVISFLPLFGGKTRPRWSFGLRQWALCVMLFYDRGASRSGRSAATQSTLPARLVTPREMMNCAPPPLHEQTAAVRTGNGSSRLTNAARTSTPHRGLSALLLLLLLLLVGWVGEFGRILFLGNHQREWLTPSSWARRQDASESGKDYRALLC